MAYGIKYRTEIFDLNGVAGKIDILENGYGLVAATYDDWFLPSRYELKAMYDELKVYGLGNFSNDNYWSSSEVNNMGATLMHFGTGVVGVNSGKGSGNVHSRPCRSFTSSLVYSLRDTGEAGGLIFAIVDNGGGSYTYYESGLVDVATNEPYSNVDATEIGATAQGTAIGTGQGNTTAIVSQIGHTTSGAKFCDNYSLEVVSDDVITDLQAGGSPLRFDFDSESDDLHDPIKPTKAIFTLKSLTNFALLSLYSDMDMDLKVNIYFNDVLYFTGYIKPNEYSEEYGDPPYDVTITAIDGLNYLKDIVFDDDGEYYDGRLRISAVLLNIFAKIGFTEFKEYVNLYETNMLDGEEDSPLDQLFDDVDKYQDMKCLDVLREILKPFNAVVRQIAGVFNIYRPSELVNATVYGRHFTGEVTKSDISITPLMQIDRSGHASDLHQGPSSRLGITGAAKTIKLNHDYGSKESWIKNWDLKGDTAITSPNFIFRDWIGQGSTGHVMSYVTTGEQDGMAIGGQNNYPTLSNYVYQVFAPHAVATSDDMFLSFKFLVGNKSGTPQTGQVFYMKVSNVAGTRWLREVDGEYCDWHTSDTLITLTVDTPVGSTGWIDWSRRLDGLPTDGEYVIYLFGADNGTPLINIAYKDIRFYTTSSEMIQTTQVIGMRPAKTRGFITRADKRFTLEPIYANVEVSKQFQVLKKIYTISNAVNGKELSFDFMNGDVYDAGVDNVVEQFQGALALKVRNAQARVDTITLIGGGTGDIALITVNGETQECEFDTDLATTAAKFVTDHDADYIGITVTSSGPDIIFTADTAGVDFFPNTSSIEPDLGTLDGTVEYTTPSFTEEALTYTTEWNSRGGAEADPLLQIVGAELAFHFKRSKHFISMQIHEKGTDPLSLSLLACLEDAVNEYKTGSARKFVINRGSLDVKNRIWSLDLVEIILE